VSSLGRGGPFVRMGVQIAPEGIVLGTSGDQFTDLSFEDCRIEGVDLVGGTGAGYVVWAERMDDEGEQELLLEILSDEQIEDVELV
jgi:hypothetical protein